MKFNIDNYKGKYVMHCKTEKEAKDFCQYLHSVGREWCDGTSYLDNTEYDVHRGDIAYNFNTNTYCEVDWYYERNYKKQTKIKE